jgi:glycosyltransferase involved in cell wall biosynthesis
LRGRFNVIYGGNLGAAQSLENVLAAAALLNDLPRVQFVLIGGGMEEAALRRRAAELRLTNVRFVAQQPAEKMPHFFAWADVLLAHLKRHPLFEITIPGKTLAYLASGRPVLSATVGDAADVIREAGAGLVCPPEDPGALAQSVRELYALSAEEREVLGQAGRHAFLRNFTRKVLLDRYEALLQDIVTRSRASA